MILVATDKVWSEFLSILSNKVNPMSYSTWIKPLELYKLDQENNKIIIKVPMLTHKAILSKEEWYNTLVDALFEITGITYEIQLLLEELTDESEGSRFQSRSCTTKLHGMK